MASAVVSDDAWSVNEYGFDYRVAPSHLTRSEPFESEEAAGEAAVECLAGAFGLPPSTLAFSVTRKPVDEVDWWRNGHIVKVRQLLDGVPVDDGVVVFLSGMAVRKATGRLHHWARGELLPHTMNAEQAKVVVEQLLAREGHGQSSLHAAIGEPELVYTHVLCMTAESEGQELEFRPAWSFRQTMPVIVDAVTGRVCVDD